jgi:glycosyltransferase 2 family protein
MPRIAFLLRLGGLLLFLAIAFWALDAYVLLQAFSHLTIGGIVTAAAAALLAITLGALRWGVLLSALGRNAGFGKVAAASFIGNAINVALPTGMGGDLVKVLLLVSSAERASISELTGTVAVDRMLGLVGCVCIAIAVLLSAQPLVHGNEVGVSLGFLGLALFAFGILGALGVIALNRRLPPRRKLWRHALAALSTMLHTVYAYRYHGGAIALGLLISVVALSSICVAIWVLALPFADLSLVSVVLAVTGTILISSLPITINGLGTRELVFIYVLGSGGLTPEQAVAISLAWFTVTMFISIILGGVALGFSRMMSLNRLSAMLAERRQQHYS